MAQLDENIARVEVGVVEEKENKRIENEIEEVDESPSPTTIRPRNHGKEGGRRRMEEERKSCSKGRAASASKGAMRQ